MMIKLNAVLKTGIKKTTNSYDSVCFCLLSINRFDENEKLLQH